MKKLLTIFGAGSLMVAAPIAVADSYNQNSDMAKQIKETAKDEEV